MKLKKNMYVRTKAGMIAKIIDKRDVSGSLHREEIVFILDNGNRLALHSKKVLKASNNIIDLIEVGDYVNGYRVYNKGIDELGHTYLSLDMNEDIHWLESEIENEEDIKSIVTKEQFSSMEYRVND